MEPVLVAAPARAGSLPVELERLVKRGGRHGQGLLHPTAEPECQCRWTGCRELQHAGDVATLREGVDPGHGTVPVEVLPAVGAAHEPHGRLFRERGAGEGERIGPTLRHDRRAQGTVGHPRGIVRARPSEVRRQERIETEGGTMQRMQDGLHEEDVARRRGADPQRQPEAWMDELGGHRGYAGLLGAHRPMHQPLGLDPETGAIGDDEFHVAHLRLVDRGPVDLVSRMPWPILNQTRSRCRWRSPRILALLVEVGVCRACPAHP